MIRTRVTQVTHAYTYREGTQDEIVAVLTAQGWFVHKELSAAAGARGLVAMVHPRLDGTIQWIDKLPQTGLDAPGEAGN